MVPNTIGLNFLHHGRSRQRPAVIQIDSQGRSTTHSSRVIKVFLCHVGIIDRDIRRHFIQRTGRIKTCSNVALSERVCTRNVIDVATVMFVITHKAKRHTIAQRNIDEAFGQVTKVARFRLPHTKTHATLKFLSAGCVGHNLNGT